MQGSGVKSKENRVPGPGQTYYWDWVRPPDEQLERARQQAGGRAVAPMSRARALTILKLWADRRDRVLRDRNTSVQLSEADLLRALSEGSRTVEQAGGRTEKGVTLQDLHEAYQVLSKLIRSSTVYR